jgi:hypothetical protein
LNVGITTSVHQWPLMIAPAAVWCNACQTAHREYAERALAPTNEIRFVRRCG